MLHPRTEPSTPLRTTAVPSGFSNYSAPLLSRISNIHLPPQELSEVLSGMSLRRLSMALLRPASGRRLASSLSKGPSQVHTPTRRLSERLTIRRRRRSSTGMVYDAGYAEPVTKEFLRAFSRALVYDKKRLSPEDDKDEMYEALDEQHRMQSVSPNDYGPSLTSKSLLSSALLKTLPDQSSQKIPSEFDYSLPLPQAPNSPANDEPLGAPEPSIASTKPTFKSYLERILESRNKSLNLRSHNKESSILHSHEPESHDFNEVINASQFVIENTLSSLPDYSGNGNHPQMDLRLEEPVAFGTLANDSSANESSEKENHEEKPLNLRPLLRLSSENATPVGTGGFEFDNLKEMEIPQWDSVLFYTSKMLTPSRESTKMMEDVSQMADNDIGSGLSPSGLILGHFTIDNEDISQMEHIQLKPALAEDGLAVESDSNSLSYGEVTLPETPTRLASPPVMAPSGSGSQIPKSLVRSFVTLAQRMPKPGESVSPPKKKFKRSALGSSTLQMVTEKSNEFLQQLMMDLEAYAGHRQSKKIDIQDAVLYMNRIRPHGEGTSQVEVISRLANTIFPLETLIALNNSLQESGEKKGRRTKVGIKDAEDEFDTSRSMLLGGGGNHNGSSDQDIGG